jgi:predicted small lipoprotein YifL
MATAFRRQEHLEMKLRLLLAAAAALLSACGQTGDLYLPDSQQGTVITRPAPPAESPAPADTPGTVDSPPAPASPAPEVTPPAGTEKPDAKKKNGTPPPR